MYRKLASPARALLFFILAAAVPFAAEAANLHAIIVADTLDHSIGDSTARDFVNMRSEARRIAGNTGLKLKEIAVSGKSALPENVLKKLSELKIEKDDVVLFYFSGHGYRTPGKGDSPWPNLYFSRVDSGLDYDDIGKRLEGYDPRLLIVISDVCNNIIADSWAPPVVKGLFFNSYSKGVVKNNYRRLFLDVSGVILITSSRAGEVSWGDERGGIFTQAFLQHLKQAVQSSSHASWYSLLDGAALQVQSEQHPDFQIFLEDS